MRSLISALRKVDYGLRGAEKFFIVGSLCFMVLSIATESLVRWIFDKGLPGASELSRYLMVYVGFLGASVATSEKRHIVIDVLAKALHSKERLVAGMTAGAYIGGAVVSGFLTYACWIYLDSFLGSGKVSPALGLPIKYAVAVMPAGMAVMTARFTIIAIEEAAASAGMFPLEELRQSGGMDDLMADAGMESDAPVNEVSHG